MAYLSELFFLYLFIFSFTVCFSFDFLCSVNVMHDVPGEERVEEFEVIYLRLCKKVKG